MPDNIFPRLSDNNGHIYELKGLALKIGRAPDCQIVIPSELCSRYHALITFSEEGLILKDLKSKNGTYLNGQRLEKEHLLVSGDVIQLGGHTFSFDDPAPTRTDNTTTVAQSRAPGSFQVNLENLVVKRYYKGQIINIPLSGNLWKLFLLLYQNQGKVCSRAEIMRTVYQEQADENLLYDNSIESLVTRLRKRLYLNKTAELPCLRSIRDQGYILEI